MISKQRQTNPFNPKEIPTFLPGDKVRDTRGGPDGPIFRIKKRVAYRDSELMTLQNVENRNEMTVIAKDLIPYLEMVAMAKDN